MKYRWTIDIVFLFFLVLFILHGILEFNLPFFWDETGVYVKLIAYMYDHVATIFPEGAPPILSRGHPLMFAFIYSTITKFFGFHTEVIHGISLSIAVLILFSIYFFCRKYFHPYVALAATLLLMVQPVFIAHSTMALPEMLLALFTFLSFYFYINNSIAMYIFMASCALLTKESAIVIPISFAIGHLLSIWITEKKLISAKFKVPLVSLLPYCIFILFIIVQKIQLGWYFFPEHVGLISFNTKEIAYKFAAAGGFLFFKQGRFLWFLPIILIFYKIFISNCKIHNDPNLIKIVTIIFVFISIAIAFSILNFFMYRYLLFCFPFLCIAIAYGLFLQWQNKIIFMALGIFAGIHLYFLSGNKFVYDADLSYKHVVHVQQEAINYLEEHSLFDQAIYADYPIDHGLTDSNMGYLKSKGFSNIVINHGSDEKWKHINCKWYILYDTSSINFNHIPYKLIPVKYFTSSFASVGIYTRSK